MDVNKYKNPVVNSEQELFSLNQQFTEKHQQLEVRLFNSNLSEKTRFIFWSYKKTIKYQQTDLIVKFFKATLKDLNSNINLSDVYDGCYIKGGTKNKGRTAKIEKIDLSQGILHMKWIAQDALVEREVKVKPSFFKGKQNIIVHEKTTGTKSLQGLQGMFLKNDYVKQRVINLQIGLLNFEIEINPELEIKNKSKINTLKKILEK
ncbi:hypothetical protein SCLARK_001207 [Spiroplasma clarkii]|uniref:Uncharacterized protein n=1 Tax=Spiroplasma clarkii TaxID=2139 RepID=A0A1Y0L178_9MOLU|nr:hypothetical protein [Spiroplasma clarkii]ARU91764.1 hypothetical protein SCLARK_001207 [Spiroplasma clarkii]ATX71136.1 hypothetical protein SCLAR_v1c08240 [Spiroplasma clarkii]